MVEMTAVSARRIQRDDQKALDQLLRLGTHYVEPQRFEYGDALVAEIPTLTPTIVGVVSWAKIGRKAGLMPKYHLTAVAVDPCLSKADGDAVIQRLLQSMYDPFKEVGRGVMRTWIHRLAADSRDLFENSGWSPGGQAKENGMITYFWFVNR